MHNEEDNRSYKVVINHEAQYSIFLADNDNPLGWQDTDKIDTKAQCLTHIDEVWTDIRPLSLRKPMENA